MNEKLRPIERKDELLHITLMDGMVRVFLLDTTHLVQKAADIHHSSPVCTAALGRLLTETAMLSVPLKNDLGSVTVQIRGGGKMGTLCAVGNGGEVKAYADNMQVVLPQRANGKLDVGTAVGKDGRLSVIRDMGIGEPYVGQAELVSGEIAEDLCQYLAVSEQQPAIVSLGVLVSGETVLTAGGILIQPLPGCDESILEQLEIRSMLFSDISREMTFAPNEELMGDWFHGLKPVIIARTPLSYACNCSKGRMEKALIALGKKELEEIIQDGEGAELTCHFCHNGYHFNTEALEELLQKATRD